MSGSVVTKAYERPTYISNSIVSWICTFCATSYAGKC